jgi:hypothetical protein
LDVDTVAAYERQSGDVRGDLALDEGVSPLACRSHMGDGYVLDAP